MHGWGKTELVAQSVLQFNSNEKLLQGFFDIKRDTVKSTWLCHVNLWDMARQDIENNGLLFPASFAHALANARKAVFDGARWKYEWVLTREQRKKFAEVIGSIVTERGVERLYKEVTLACFNDVLDDGAIRGKPQHILVHFDEAGIIARSGRTDYEKRKMILEFWNQVPFMDVKNMAVQPFFTSRQWDLTLVEKGSSRLKHKKDNIHSPTLATSIEFDLLTEKNVMELLEESLDYTMPKNMAKLIYLETSGVPRLVWNAVREFKKPENRDIFSPSKIGKLIEKGCEDQVSLWVRDVTETVQADPQVFNRLLYYAILGAPVSAEMPIFDYKYEATLWANDSDEKSHNQPENYPNELSRENTQGSLGTHAEEGDTDIDSEREPSGRSSSPGRRSESMSSHSSSGSRVGAAKVSDGMHEARLSASDNDSECESIYVLEGARRAGFYCRPLKVGKDKKKFYIVVIPPVLFRSLHTVDTLAKTLKIRDLPSSFDARTFEETVFSSFMLFSTFVAHRSDSRRGINNNFTWGQSIGDLEQTFFGKAFIRHDMCFTCLPIVKHRETPIYFEDNPKMEFHANSVPMACEAPTFKMAERKFKDCTVKEVDPHDYGTVLNFLRKGVWGISGDKSGSADALFPCYFEADGINGTVWLATQCKRNTAIDFYAGDLEKEIERARIGINLSNKNRMTLLIVAVKRPEIVSEEMVPDGIAYYASGREFTKKSGETFKIPEYMDVAILWGPGTERLLLKNVYDYFDKLGDNEEPTAGDDTELIAQLEEGDLKAWEDTSTEVINMGFTKTELLEVARKTGVSLTPKQRNGNKSIIVAAIRARITEPVTDHATNPHTSLRS